MNQLTPNQVIAYNLRRARGLHGWTQETAAEQLEPLLGQRWSRAVFSAAERSVAGERIRQFTGDDLVAFAAAFGLPVSFFFLPPRDAEAVAAPNAQESLSPDELTDLATTDVEAAVAEHRERAYRRFEDEFGGTVIHHERKDRR